jgi:hexosaminidase
MNGPVNAAQASSFKAAVFIPDTDMHSLVFQLPDPAKKYARYGKKIGTWKSKQVGNGKPETVVFDATGLIDKSGDYILTFIYTSGRYRLDIDGIKVMQNDTKQVAQDIHHGYASRRAKRNQYNISIKDYETGASYKIYADIYGDQGDDSNGLVFIKRKK